MKPTLSAWIAVVVLLLALAPAAAAEEPAGQGNTLTVTGRGTVQIPTPDARIVLGVEVRRETAGEAQVEAARRSAAVVELVRRFEVEELETTRISLSPEYHYESRERRLVGFTATNLVSFRLPVERGGELLDGAVRAGATRIDSVQLVPDDEELARAESRAVAGAARQARKRARTVLGALGLEEVEIVRIQVGDRPDRPVPSMMRLMDAAETDPRTPVLPGLAEVSAQVTLEIRYR